MADGRITDAFADKLVKAWFNRSVTGLPTSYYIGLATTLPTDQNGTGLVVPSNAEFARIGASANTTNWVSMGVGSRQMSLNIDLLYATAVTDWGEIVGYTMHDTLTAGTFLGYGVTNPFTILAGMRARLPAGSVTIKIPS